MKTIGKGSLSSFLAGLLNVAWYGVLVLLILATCLLAVSPWVDPPRLEVNLAVPVAVNLDGDSHRVEAAAEAVNIHLTDVRASLQFSPRQPAVIAGIAAAVMAVLALVLWFVGELRAVFRTLREGQPFDPANAGRIGRIGWAVVFGEVLRASIDFAGNAYAMSTFTAEGLRFTIRPQMDFVTVVTGLIIVVIAEVFRAGTRLDEDQSLTV